MENTVEESNGASTETNKCSKEVWSKLITVSFVIMLKAFIAEREKLFILQDRRTNESSEYYSYFASSMPSSPVEEEEEDYHGNDNHKGCHQPRGRSHRKVTLIEWIFGIANLISELFAMILDQLSSTHNSHYALMSLLMSILSVIICITELIYKGRKERVVWRWKKGIIPWFYHSTPSEMPFGTFIDIVGILCAICQCIVTSIKYSLYVRHVDYSLKICTWPLIFALGVLCSKLYKNFSKQDMDGHGRRGRRPHMVVIEP